MINRYTEAAFYSFLSNPRYDLRFLVTTFSIVKTETIHHQGETRARVYVSAAGETL